MKTPAVLYSGDEVDPVHTFEAFGTTFHFDVDDGCLRLLIPGDHHYKPTTHWFPEALKQLEGVSLVGASEQWGTDQYRAAFELADESKGPWQQLLDFVNTVGEGRSISLQALRGEFMLRFTTGNPVTNHSTTIHRILSFDTDEQFNELDTAREISLAIEYLARDVRYYVNDADQPGESG